MLIVLLQDLPKDRNCMPVILEIELRGRGRAHMEIQGQNIEITM